MTEHKAKGSFEVKTVPITAPDAVPGRFSLDKQFSGDLTATGKGEMMTAMGTIKGSAAYVAIEQVSGTLHGRSGGFIFQHAGTMSGGSQQLSITVVPDSGTGELAGISGRLAINIVEGRHFYEFDYSLAQARSTAI